MQRVEECVHDELRWWWQRSLSLTISDTPPTNTSVVSFSLPIIGITLTPSSGSAVPVFSSNPSTDFELTRLQTDTNLVVANVTIAAGTYTAVNVTVAAPSGVYVNSSGATLGACVNTAVCGITGSAATITYKFPSGSPLVLASNSTPWLDLDFNYNNAVVTVNNAVSIDVTQTGVMTASNAVPAGVASGAYANLDDFTGAVTAISSSSITVAIVFAWKPDGGDQFVDAGVRPTKSVHERDNRTELHSSRVDCQHARSANDSRSGDGHVPGHHRHFDDAIG